METEQSRFFGFLRKTVRLFTKDIETIWTEPFNNTPSIFVCNHDRAYGPIAMCAHFDMCEEVRPWITSPVLSARTIPAHVRGDNWWAPERWYTPLLDHTVPYLVAPILPCILKGSACIPIYYDTRVLSTFRDSVKMLQAGKHIVLFPEHSTGYCQYQSEIVTGFISLGRAFYRRTKQCLSFYPTFVDWTGKVIRVAKPIAYDPTMKAAEFTKMVKETVEEFFSTHGGTVPREVRPAADGASPAAAQQ